jgi:hypothetical protein
MCGMSPVSRRSGQIALAAAAFAAIVAVCAWLVRPFDGGPAATDAAASVLYFDRIAAGRHLEAFVNATPKPLLTLVFGALHALTGGWVAGAWASVLVLAAGIVMGAELVRRVAGPEAAVFAAVGLVGSVALLAETSLGLGLPWAFALWVAAGFALLRPEPRYGLAGLGLLLAALARQETFLFLAVATAYLVWRLVRGPRPPRSSWLILVGWFALVVLAIHDYALTGDPLWWTKVAAISAAHQNVGSVVHVARRNAAHLVGLWGLLVFGLVGALALIRRRSWLAFSALGVMGPLVALLTLVLAWRDLAVLDRYFHPIDLAIIISAAIGAGAMLAAVRQRAIAKVSGPVQRGIPAVTLASAAVLAVVLSSPFAPTSAAARRTIGAQADVALRIDSLTPILKEALRSIPASDPPEPGPYLVPDPADIRVFVPRYQGHRLAVILDESMSRLRWIDPGRVDLSAGYPAVGSLLYFDGVLSPPSVTKETAVLRPSVPTVVGNVRIVPVMVDEARQVWIERIEAAP